MEITKQTKSIPVGTNHLIEITKTCSDVMDPNYPHGPSLGYSDIYQLTDDQGQPAGRGFSKGKVGHTIVWICDDPFTFLVVDSNHWETGGRAWKTLPLGNGDMFYAINSVPIGSSNLLSLGIRKHSKAERGYTVNIPQLDLSALVAAAKAKRLVSGNSIVRATVILQR